MPSIKSRKCTKCSITKPVEDFNSRPKRRGGREEQCKKCTASRAKAHNEANPEQYKARYTAVNCASIEKKKVWHKVTIEKRRAYGKAYYFNNKDKVNARHKIYHTAHPEKTRTANRKRRALKMGNNHETYQDSDIFERDGWMCGICGQKINKRLKWPNPRSKSIDHIVPLLKGGPDAAINLQAAHLRCNQGKRTNNNGQLLLIG